jgi:hypothetical protein
MADLVSLDPIGLRRRGRGVNNSHGMNISSNSVDFCILPVIMTHNTPWLLSNSPQPANLTTWPVHPPPVLERPRVTETSSE